VIHRLGCSSHWTLASKTHGSTFLDRKVVNFPSRLACHTSTSHVLTTVFAQTTTPLSQHMCVAAPPSLSHSLIPCRSQQVPIALWSALTSCAAGYATAVGSLNTHYCKLLPPPCRSPSPLTGWGGDGKGGLRTGARRGGNPTMQTARYKISSFVCVTPYKGDVSPCLFCSVLENDHECYVAPCAWKLLYPRPASS